ncbi:MAG TPA: PAS domain-containing protein, partial [Acetobacteraceae bacterium]|nr:PAS domain-containing protein [Acetobacteraceae bacterium]
ALYLLAAFTWRAQRRLALANEALEERVAERTAALAESEARLRRVQEIGRVGGFEIDLLTGRNQRSAEYMRLQGAAPVEATEFHQDWVRRLHPADRERAERYFLDAISDASGMTRYAQDYRIVTPEGTTQWISARAEIERDARGRAVRMVGAHLDVTELKAAQTALIESAARLRAAVRGARLGAWERDLRRDRGWWDARAAEIYGGMQPEEAPDRQAWESRVHPEDRPQRRAAIQAAIAPGGPDHYDVEFRFRREDGGWNWIAVHGAVVERDPRTGEAVRLAGTVQDVTERREAEAQRARLLYEVDHRARNTLALVVAIMRLTPREGAEDFAAAVEGRVNALARLHSSLAEGRWGEVDLRVLAEAELMAVLGPVEMARRVAPLGPGIAVTPAAAQAFCLVLHELATNARRHGAFSTPHGRLDLTWQQGAEGGLRMTWKETGGPLTGIEPACWGFGLRMVDTTVRHQLDGTLRLDWHPDGLCCAIEGPAAGLRPAASG